MERTAPAAASDSLALGFSQGCERWTCSHLAWILKYLVENPETCQSACLSARLTVLHSTVFRSRALGRLAFWPFRAQGRGFAVGYRAATQSRNQVSHRVLDGAGFHQCLFDPRPRTIICYDILQSLANRTTATVPTAITPPSSS